MTLFEYTSQQFVIIRMVLMNVVIFTNQLRILKYVFINVIRKFNKLYGFFKCGTNVISISVTVIILLKKLHHFYHSFWAFIFKITDSVSVSVFQKQKFVFSDFVSIFVIPVFRCIRLFKYR